MQLHTMGFHYLPTHAVTCTLATRDQVDAVHDDLRNAGFRADRILVLEGESGLRWLDPTGTRHGGFARAVRAIQRTCSEGEEAFLNHARQALEAGQFVMVVETDGTMSQRYSIRDIVKSHATGTLFYCGKLSIEEI